MQDNEIDKLINDAANQHHPPYDDEAWGKMLVLLDKHLPQKKDRRRPVVFWLLFLLLGGAVTLGIVQPWNKNNPGSNSIASIDKKAGNNTGTTTTTEKTEGNNTAATGSAGPSNIAAPSYAAGTGINNTATPADIAVVPQAKSNKNSKDGSEVNGIAVSDDVFAKTNKTAFASKGKSVIKIRKPAATDEENNAAAPAEQPANKTANITELPVEEAANKTAGIKEPAEEKTTVTKTVKQNSTAPQKDTAVKKPDAATAATDRNKKDRSFAGNFALTFSTGADMSFIDLKNPGKIKLFYGAGAAYNIGKHLKVSSGFYVSKKEYYAEPYQYKFPNGTAYPHLTGIEANCNVYEIPVNLYYNFAARKNHNWFAGAGISSFLMKKEYYNYQYASPTGQAYSYARTITDENKHYFSIVTLSGGYQYAFNKHFALIAEPYLKLPLAGVGAGKIKLNSSGILLTAAIKPFAKTKK